LHIVASDLLELMTRVARAMEAVVPDLTVTPVIGGRVWLADQDETPDGWVDSPDQGVWATYLGFGIGYPGNYYGEFFTASGGSEREQIQAVARNLLSQVQDVVAETTREPWPRIVVDGRQDMALSDVAIEGDELVMWYGDRDAPALRLPRVELT
jgi:hypothetical protein